MYNVYTYVYIYIYIYIYICMCLGHLRGHGQGHLVLPAAEAVGLGPLHLGQLLEPPLEVLGVT